MARPFNHSAKSCVHLSLSTIPLQTHQQRSCCAEHYRSPLCFDPSRSALGLGRHCRSVRAETTLFRAVDQNPWHAVLLNRDREVAGGVSRERRAGYSVDDGSLCAPAR